VPLFLGEFEMLIETSIKARRENTVILTSAQGNRLVFSEDGSGRLVAEIADPIDLAFVLSRSDFSPLDEADFARAESLIRQQAKAEDLSDDDLPDDSGDMQAAPVETLTPPKPAKPAKPGK
jgi:hypothetical protein